MTTAEINPLYADLYSKLDVREVAIGRWQVTYNGKIIGDDRGYSNEAAARVEVNNRIVKDEADARRYDRPVLLSK